MFFREKKYHLLLVPVFIATAIAVAYFVFATRRK